MKSSENIRFSKISEGTEVNPFDPACLISEREFTEDNPLDISMKTSVENNRKH